MEPIDLITRQKHVLIFEPLSGGHRLEFLRHLLDYVSSDSCLNETRYTFVLNTISAGFSDSSNIRFEALSDVDREFIGRAHTKAGSFAFWHVLTRYIEKLRPDRLLIMDLTYLELALCCMRLPCKTSAILFVQYPELRASAKTSLRAKLKVAAKELKTRLLLLNRNLEKVFLLNGEYSCRYLNERFKTERFYPVPDPVPAIEAEIGFNFHSAYGIERNRRIFLCFGSMSLRKGIRQLVSSLMELDDESAMKSTFIFCGKPEPRFEDSYHHLICQLKHERPDVSLHIDETFVSSSRMRAMFEQSDWVLIPYTRPEYSSGILAHAAAARTPVIGPRDGLLGRQIRDHKLGLDIPVNKNALVRALIHAAKHNFEFDDAERTSFVIKSNPKNFASIVLRD